MHYKNENLQVTFFLSFLPCLLKVFSFKCIYTLQVDTRFNDCSNNEISELINRDK